MAEVLVEAPSFADWFHYMMLVTASALYGPSVEYRTYLEFINLRGDYSKMTPFSNFGPAVLRFAQCIVCIGIFMGSKTLVDMEYMIQPGFKNEAFWFKCLLLVAS